MILETVAQIKKVPDLVNLAFKVPKLANKDKRREIDSEDLVALFNGIPVSLHISIESIFTPEKTRYLTIYINLSTKTERNIANVSLNIQEIYRNWYVAKTSVGNRTKELKGQGLGRTLWEISLQMIQKVSDEWGVPIRHEVLRYPEEGLSTPKWNILFLPLLEKYSYKKISRDEWDKKYKPNK